VLDDVGRDMLTSGEMAYMAPYCRNTDHLPSRNKAIIPRSRSLPAVQKQVIA